MRGRIFFVHIRLREMRTLKREKGGNSLAVQWLGIGALTAKGPGSVPGQGTKIPQATWCG